MLSYEILLYRRPLLIPTITNASIVFFGVCDGPLMCETRTQIKATRVEFSRLGWNNNEIVSPVTYDGLHNNKLNYLDSTSPWVRVLYPGQK